MAPLDGGSCLNQRTMLDACHLLYANSEKNNAKAPIPISELLEALWFLELVLVSKEITCDGTLPNQDLAILSEVLDQLTSDSGFTRKNFNPVNP